MLRRCSLPIWSPWPGSPMGGLGGGVCGGALCAHARETRINITASRRLFRFIRFILSDSFDPSICPAISDSTDPWVSARDLSPFPSLKQRPRCETSVAFFFCVVCDLGVYAAACC